MSRRRVHLEIGDWIVVMGLPRVFGIIRAKPPRGRFKIEMQSTGHIIELYRSEVKKLR